MKINYLKLLATLTILTGIIIIGCKKTDKVVTPQALAHFTNQSSGSYFITGPAVTYKIPVGVTTVSGVDRTVNISITSPTGAVAGTHYTANSSVVIPAGKAVDSLEIKGIYAQYTAGRKDTLVITIQNQDVPPSEYNSKFVLFMRGPCSELEINDPGALEAFKGDYKNTNETFGSSPYGPYKTTVLSVTKTSATTADIVIANIYDDNWSPTTYTLNWTNINNKMVTLVAQNAGGNAANTFGPSYNGMPYAIRPASSGAVGTFSYCNQTIQIKANIGIWGVGYSSTLYTVNLAK